MAGSTDRVRQILSWYGTDNTGVKTNLARLMNHGALAGTGKFVILPVDQGFEHGPARSFAPNPPAYDPDYHFQLAIEAGCNAYAAPLGSLELSSDRFIGQVPTILKLNNSDTLAKMPDPCSAVTASVKDAVRLGCSAIGYTIYPGSGQRNVMYEELRELVREAKEYGLPTIVWAYPRGSGMSKDGELAIDVVAYAAQISCQLGAHIVKVKPPTDFLEQPEAKKVYEKYAIPIKTMADRVKHVVQSAMNGRRIVIFSGGEAKETDALLEQVRGLADGGAFGTIMGRNAFQRPKAEALKLLSTVMDIFRKAG
jgi:class I fructose-bisphosphate aldolase